MKNDDSNSPKPINQFTKNCFDYSEIGQITRDTFIYNGKQIISQVLKTYSNSEENKNLFLYLFPGQGGNEEWDKDAHISKLMTYIQNEIKKHPAMTIVMPHIFYGGSDQVREAQQITDYIEGIINYYEGENAWEQGDGYKKRAVAGLCLGSLCAMKCALHCQENQKTENEECKNKKYLNNFQSAGVFSPAGGAEDGYWLNGKPNFKFNRPQDYRLYLSYGECDNKDRYAKNYHGYFEDNNSPVNDYAIVNKGAHDWNAFIAGFVDFMSKEIFDSEFYK